MKTAILSLLLVGAALPAPPITLQEVSGEYLPLDHLMPNSMDVEVADLDGDGDKDMVIAMEFRPNVLLLNDGKGRMIYASPGRLPQKNHDSEDIALGDFDGDGDTDIVFVSEDDRVHEYYLNDGKAVFSDASDRFPFNATCNAVDAADFDGDGDLDLVLGNAGQEFLLLNDGKGTFTDATAGRMPQDETTTQDVQSTDLEGDGDLDLILGSEDGNRIYLNSGKGVFTDATADRLPGAHEETRKVDLADIDGDGDLDLFFSNVDFRKGMDIANRILINTGKGFFRDETGARFRGVNNMHTGDALFGDLDRDGDPDLILANLFGGYSQVLQNDGKGVFTEITDTAFRGRVTGDAISLEWTDLDKNGKPEIYFGMFRGTDRLFKVQ